MRFLLALLLPPLAVLACGKPIQALLNAGLTLCLYFPGVIHALFVVSSHKADLRADAMARKVVAALGGQQEPLWKRSPIVVFGGLLLLCFLLLSAIGSFMHS